MSYFQKYLFYSDIRKKLLLELNSQILGNIYIYVLNYILEESGEILAVLQSNDEWYLSLKQEKKKRDRKIGNFPSNVKV